MRRLLPVVTLIVLAACATPSRSPDARAPSAAEPFKPTALRQPAVFVRVAIGEGRFSTRQAAALPAEYEGTLLEALNARAVPARDVRLVSPRDRLDPGAAVARAREVGAEHAILIEATARQTAQVFCQDGKRPFRATVTLWSQHARIFRATDGSLAFETADPVEVSELEPDCDNPRQSRQRSPSEHLSQAVETLVKRLLGS